MPNYCRFQLLPTFHRFIIMEHKQLNFNQPILSVRRYSTAATTTTSAVKTEKCKNDTSCSLPPLPYYRSELKSGPVSNPGTVPFTWERSPGRPKDDANHPHFKNHSVAPKLPPGWTLKKQTPSSKINEYHGGSNIPEDKFEESKENEGKSDSDSDSVSNSDSNAVHDEVYLDALDTLSRTESFFLNCSSMSGLSEKPAGAFSADPQTRDFMMARFLPAAKAMAAEIPQSSKKQNFPREQPSRKEKEKPPVVRPKASNIPTYMEYHKEVESEVDEEDDYYDEPGNLQNKACGLLPRFCLKSSFCLLNPVPRMSMRTRVPMSPVSSVRTRSSPTAGLCSKSEDQPTGQVSTYEQKRVGGFGATEQNESHIKLDGSPQPSFSDSEEFHAISGAMNNEFHDFHSGEKRLSSLQELFADPSSSCSEESGIITNLTVEKTVYVDSVHKMATKSKSCSSDEDIPKSLKEDDIHSLKDREEDSNNSIKKSTDQPQNLVRPAEDHDHSYSQRSTFSTNTRTQSHLKQELLPYAKNTSRFNPEFPLPPPLPKSPSESWLCQALPAISKSSLSWKNQLASQTDLQSMASKVPPVDPKWETLVKMKKTQHQY